MTTCCRKQAAGELVDASEVVLTVAVAHPANAQQTLQQWRVLGGQRLTMLRDRLYCRSDLDMRGAGLSVPSGGSAMRMCLISINLCFSSAVVG
jgi:hypothetical protein